MEDCKTSVDITLKSIDGITFGAHQKNLEFFSEGFPVAGSRVATEVVQLQENADVLRIMLKFMHNARIPELKRVQFSTIAPLAEAVEKYMIYSAMEVCRAYMEFVSIISLPLVKAYICVMSGRKLRVTLLRCSCTRQSTDI